MKQPFWNNVSTQPTALKFTYNNPSYYKLGQSIFVSADGNYLSSVTNEVSGYLENYYNTRLQTFNMSTRTYQSSATPSPSGTSRPHMGICNASADGTRFVVAQDGVINKIFVCNTLTGATVASWSGKPHYVALNYDGSVVGSATFDNGTNLFSMILSNANTGGTIRTIASTGGGFYWPVLSRSGNIVINVAFSRVVTFVNANTGANINSYTAPSGADLIPNVSLNDQTYGYTVDISGVRYFKTFRIADNAEIYSVAFPSTSHSIFVNPYLGYSGPYAIWQERRAISYDLSCALITTSVNGSQILFQKLQENVSFPFKTYNSSTDTTFQMNHNGSIICTGNPNANSVLGQIYQY